MAEMDLRDLLTLIVEQKNLNANLAMDLGCQIELTDPKPLVKVLNYCFNLLEQMTDQPMNVTLNRMQEAIRLSMMISTDAGEPPAFSPKVDKYLQNYQAFSDQSFEAGKYYQILITFWIEA